MKAKYIYFFLVMLCFSSSVYAQELEQPNSEYFDVTVIMQKETVQLNEPVGVRIEIKNISNKVILLPRLTITGAAKCHLPDGDISQQGLSYQETKSQIILKPGQVFNADAQYFSFHADILSAGWCKLIVNVHVEGVVEPEAKASEFEKDCSGQSVNKVSEMQLLEPEGIYKERYISPDGFAYEDAMEVLKKYPKSFPAALAKLDMMIWNITAEELHDYLGFSKGAYYKKPQDIIDDCINMASDFADDEYICAQAELYKAAAYQYVDKNDEARAAFKEYINKYAPWTGQSLNYPIVKKLFENLYNKKNVDMNAILAMTKAEREKFMDEVEKGWRNSGDDDNKGYGNDPDKVDEDNRGKSGEKK